MTSPHDVPPAEVPPADVPPPGRDADAAEIQADIERTRAALGTTVEALSEKLDVKKQAQNTVHDVRQRATEQAKAVQARGGEIYGRAKDAATDEHGAVTPPVAVAAGAITLAAVVFLIWGARR